MTMQFWVREKLTPKDKRRGSPVIRKWLESLYDESDVDLGKIFSKIEEVSWKTRPPRPVVIYRCPRTPGETGEYDRWTSWSYDRDIAFGFGGSCHGRRIMAMVHPDDIEIVLPAFGDKIYPEGMAEVILKPGRYIVRPANTFEQLSQYPPLSPMNYPPT